MKQTGFLCTAIGLILSTTVGCHTWNLESDHKAQEALTALEKVEAKAETGTSRAMYADVLGDANFAVKQFLESDKANSVPEFSNALRNSIRWYKAASEVWDRELDSPVAYWVIVRPILFRNSERTYCVRRIRSLQRLFPDRCQPLAAVCSFQ